MFLTADELVELTGKKQILPQARWLTDKGIPYRLEDRRVLVLKEDTIRWIHGDPAVVRRGINWAAVT